MLTTDWRISCFMVVVEGFTVNEDEFADSWMKLLLDVVEHRRCFLILDIDDFEPVPIDRHLRQHLCYKKWGGGKEFLHRGLDRFPLLNPLPRLAKCYQAVVRPFPL